MTTDDPSDTESASFSDSVILSLVFDEEEEQIVADLERRLVTSDLGEILITAHCLCEQVIEDHENGWEYGFEIPRSQDDNGNASAEIFDLSELVLDIESDPPLPHPARVERVKITRDLHAILRKYQDRFRFSSLENVLLLFLIVLDLFAGKIDKGFEVIRVKNDEVEAVILSNLLPARSVTVVKTMLS